MGMQVSFFVEDQPGGGYFEKVQASFLRKRKKSRAIIRKKTLMKSLMPHYYGSYAMYSIH